MRDHRFSPAAMAIAVALAAVAASPAAHASSPTVVSVGRQPVGALLPTDFLGLSLEATTLGSAALDPATSNLPALMEDLGHGHLRIGGNSLDRTVAWVGPGGSLPSWAKVAATPADLATVATLANTTGWSVDLGVGLGHDDPSAAASEAAAAVSALGARLDSIDIGNEPNDFASTAPVLDPSGYSYATYRSQVNAYRAAIAAAAPTAPIAGPDTTNGTAGLAWFSSYASDERQGLVYLGGHDYPLSTCGTDVATVSALLSPATAAKESALFSAMVGVAEGAGLPVRLSEANSVSCGGSEAVSNTFASALWAVDFLLRAGSAGIGGVNFHSGSFSDCIGYNPVCEQPLPSSGPVLLEAQPEFYAMLLVRELEGGRFIPVTVSGGSAELTAYAVRRAATTEVVVDDFDPTYRGTVEILPPPGARRGRVSFLRGASLSATGGVTLGGATVEAGGTYRLPAGGALHLGRRGEARLKFTAPAAALVVFTS